MKYLKNVTSLKFFQEKCTGCRRCIEVCPHQVFDFKVKKAFLTDINKCMECGACALNCSYEAIKVDSGVGCASAIITGMINNTEPDCDCNCC